VVIYRERLSSASEVGGAAALSVVLLVDCTARLTGMTARRI
jgi:hypothetical protein